MYRRRNLPLSLGAQSTTRLLDQSQRISPRWRETLSLLGSRCAGKSFFTTPNRSPRKENGNCLYTSIYCVARGCVRVFPGPDAPSVARAPLLTAGPFAPSAPYYIVESPSLIQPSRSDTRPLQRPPSIPARVPCAPLSLQTFRNRKAPLCWPAEITWVASKQSPEGKKL